MKAAIIKSPFNLVVEEVPKPVCGDDQILLKVTRACFCKETDWQIYTHTSPFHNERDECWFPGYPHSQGHECGGVVEEVGKNVKGFEKGERLGYYYQMTGAFAQYVTFNPADMAIIRLSDKWSDDESCMVEPIIGTLRGLWSSGFVPGDKVAVFGQGAMGLLHQQHLRNFGAAAVVVTDISEFRLGIARKLGADLAVNVANRSLKDVSEEILSKIGEVDLVIDAIGDNLADESMGIDLGSEILRPEGNYFIYGFPNKRRTLDLTRFSGKLIKMYMRQCPLDRAQRLANIAKTMVEDGRLQLKPLITNHIKLSEIAEGIKLCDPKNDRDIKVIIDVNK